MRLIDTETLELVEFFDSSIPPYAILSHTWETAEVTFQDMTSTPRPTAKAGYGKIVKTCLLARIMGFKHAWIDTCCIDKSSSAELTESINSMFAWYRQSLICFVYLSDYSLPHSGPLGSSRWFSRGWTLQELLAPGKVEFYDKHWNLVGTKLDMCDDLVRITSIPAEVIKGIEPLDEFSVAQRMSWAARRQTTRLEDRAYSLLGVFDIHMPLIYGEGVQAFRRLQEEIIKRVFDMSIFSWEPDDNLDGVCSPLATSPDAFRDNRWQVRLHYPSQGWVRDPLPRVTARHGQDQRRRI
ncbi:hypothetical protein B0T24DRAFT_660749 [Lasiosphaeria ovina]|uniref:Heterokaryon incompatibility domain-containing protein n=1 Tax=Lasiosphaeria ovina TaxID=92902 RepID=A0AAE0JSJ7_9PEZI|nr:hypothetical protein B0T24DRAFT_660749 [Lasiosphaeria ovina]